MNVLRMYVCFYVCIYVAKQFPRWGLIKFSIYLVQTQNLRKISMVISKGKKKQGPHYVIKDSIKI